MRRVLIARMNANEDALDEFHDWYNNQHMEGASAITGFGTNHRRYEALAIEGRYWNYRPDPRFTAIYDLEGSDLENAINSDEYKAWSGDFLERWRDRTTDEVSIICDQIFGDEGSIEYQTVLIAQMNVQPDSEEEFNNWYNDEHIPQASQIGGFGSDHRRFRALEVKGKYWHYRPVPKYTALYEIEAGANIEEAINSDEYRAWSGDFLARWRDRTSGEVSTICKRIY
jgi:hypothetical protein